MKYLVIVISYNEIQVIKPFATLIKAQAAAIELANVFFSKNAVAKFFDGSKIESMVNVHEYYASQIYHDFEDSVNIVIEEVHL
ncbi:hypothetical protein [Candidatus Sulfurimonas baltica]|uniref:Uncharacterized protein n=1 Tax=Candidatus Sulfurimonas baltica TaxID=2740404 RepID=A0A7S7LSU4_9BACT|nr:hypothetical protein [Candidatus Sulfurimonas baltica]QOY50926.1 hypothetical protein HUE88_07155 [Candidatus Sulfurimonas baltica]